MTALDPILGAQVFEIKPEWWRVASQHGGEIAVRQAAGEALDDDIGRMPFGKIHIVAGLPTTHADIAQHLLIACSVE